MCKGPEAIRVVKYWRKWDVERGRNSTVRAALGAGRG